MQPGYAGGQADAANYKAVCSGSTGHAEVIRIVYDPAKLSYGQLLKVFFAVAHDPTQKDRQGNDVGTQYRSAVFPLDAAQRDATQRAPARAARGGRWLPSLHPRAVRLGCGTVPPRGSAQPAHPGGAGDSAVIAYRQPVTRGRVSAIRGVNVDAVARTLISRGLIAEVGTDPETGAGLYATTDLFLEKLGLAGLDELPSLAALLPDIDELGDDELGSVR